MSNHSRRAVLAGIAAAPALAAPALALSGAAPPDPIFAALAEHRRLDGMQYDIWERLEAIEVWGQREIDLEAERCRICEAADQVGWTLTKIRPTTAAGAGRLITYVRGDLETGEWQSPAMCNALEALAGMGDAALPAALAAPAIAMDLSADAELLDLGRQFEPIIDEWRAQRLLDRQQSAEHDAACERAGLPRIKEDSLPTDEWLAYMERRNQISWPVGSEDDDVWDRIHDRMYALLDQILALKAKTAAGVAVQLRAFSVSGGLWDGTGCNSDDVRKLFDSIYVFIGVTPLPLTLPENVS